MAATEQVAKWHKRFVIGSVVLVVVAGAAYIAYDFWTVAQKTQAILRAPGIIKASDARDIEKSDEGVETTPPATVDFSKHVVPPDAPRLLTIESLQLTARVQPMGLNTDKSIQSPKNIYDAGWYTASAKPGQAGALFIDGHASGASRQGLFAYLDTMKAGDKVGIEKGNGEKLTYEAVRVVTIPLASIDMSTILVPYAGVTNGLNLMTCTGKWMKDAATLDKRVVVYTRQV